MTEDPSQKPKSSWKGTGYSHAPLAKPCLEIGEIWGLRLKFLRTPIENRKTDHKPF